MFIEDVTHVAPHGRHPLFRRKKLEVCGDGASRCVKQNGFRNLELRSSKSYAGGRQCVHVWTRVDLMTLSATRVASSRCVGILSGGTPGEHTLSRAYSYDFIHRQLLFQERLLEYMRAVRR